MRQHLAMTTLGLICAAGYAAEGTRPEGMDRGRQTAAGLNLTSQVATIRDASLVRLGNRYVLVELDSTSGEWNATWLGKTKAAVHGVRFSVQVNDQHLARTAPKTTTEPFTDKLGTGTQVVEMWGDSIRMTRRLRLYDDRPIITISASMANTGDRDVSLGAASLVDVSDAAKGGWELGAVDGAPGVVYVRGSADPACEPAWDAGSSAQKERGYAGTMLLSFAAPSRQGGLTMGFLSALEARPDVSAKYMVGRGGTALCAAQQFMGRKLAAGRKLELDPVYLAASDDPYAGLERYGDAVAAHCRVPTRKGANSMWCSWYAHRMAMTEDLVLANAAVVARHFKPLGMDLVQMDHGWQQGDLTGNWMTNERFPHGLKWLAEQLRSKYGLKLGIWVAPTDVAETSELFKQHADWMLKDDQGKPKVNWKWYWKPYPDCYELDASNPGAARWIEETFARLRGEGIEYFKIDFLASCGADHFRNHDPYVTRGWSVLRQAMESIRRGAGEKAWIRYIGAPPLLSAGVGDSVCAGEDTADAGLNGKLDLLIANARGLAAGYWLNDRLYHRELCDMSVRMQADIEEVRLRLAMMTLADCSISFSDEFQYLPPSRIAMMQQCLPPGNPPMRPLDLFERTVPSIWRVHCKTPADEWDVVGLFNWEDKPQERTIEFEQIGLPNDAEVAAFEFWQSELLGVYRRQLKLTMAPQTSRIVALRRVVDVPQVVGTDMHLLSGYHELPVTRWDGDKLILSGECRRAAGLSGRIFVRVPPKYSPKFNFPLDAESAGLTHVRDQLWMLEIRFEQPTRTWSIPFVKN